MKRMRRMAFTALSLVLVAVGFLVAVRVQEQSISIDPRLVKADNEFAFKLFREVMEGEGDRNVFISPASIALALHMTYNGASGKTKKAMAKTLGIQDMTLDELNRANAGLIGMLKKADRSVEVAVGNSIWADAKISPDFATRVEKSYDAEFGPLDSVRMDNWVKKKTRGKIPTIGPHPKGASAFLLNVIYFKGTWTMKFDKSRTRDLPFRLPDGTLRQAPMMWQSGEHDYLSTPDLQALRLPYGDGRMAMYVFLPKHGSNLKHLIRKLDDANWQTWMGQFKKTDIDIWIPRFRLEYEQTLNRVLSDMGMGCAFSPADITGVLSSISAWISFVKHKTFVEVNEEGTEAAAATAVALDWGGGPPSFTADRPFFYAIRDDETGLILFMGVVTDPAQEAQDS